MRLGTALHTWLGLGLFASVHFACGDSSGEAPSDDPADYDVDTTVEYELLVSEPRFVVPSTRLPPEVTIQPSNNNVDIIFFDDRLFMAWRTSETHWASASTEMHLVSSLDEGQSWQFETTISIGADLREPRFLALEGTLSLVYFEAGTSMVSFTPKHMWRIERRADGTWTEPETFGREAEVPWDLKVRGGVGYLTSYAGNHYSAAEESVIEVYFQATRDGRSWAPVDSGHVVSYTGGVSEVAFELDEDGNAWFVTRNEDGDASGFGAHLCQASAGALAAWRCPEHSDPERYDSPEMFRHGDEIYLIARRDLGGPFDQMLELPLAQARLQNAVAYWGRPKRTAIYRVNKQHHSIEHLVDLPSAGDTAFASVRRTGAHTFLVANYTSPLDRPDISWSEGQGSTRGTQIYFVTLTFAPAGVTD